jgi:hypothetical protein
MKEIVQQTYEQLFKKLLHEIEEMRKQKSSQPEFLLPRIKEIIIKYLEDMFYATIFTTQNSERIYDPQWQRELTCSLYAHFQLIKQSNWSSFDFNMIELFEACMIEICDKYHVNANIVKKAEDISVKIATEEKIRAPSEENVMDEFLGIVSLKQLESYPLYFVLQVGKNYFSRVAEYSVFAKIFDHQTQEILFKAYYYDPEDKKIKQESAKQLVMESKKDGLYIGGWQDLPYLKTVKQANVVKIAERSLTLYEINDFKLGIKGLKKLHLDVLKLFKSEYFRWMPLELSKIILEYVVYEIPFKLIGQMYFPFIMENVDKYLDRRPGLELFDRMKSYEVYKKYNRIFYYCSNSNMIHCWTRKKLKKGVQFDYIYRHPLQKTHDSRSPGDAIVKRSLGWSTDVQKCLGFITESTRKKLAKGSVVEHKREYYPQITPLIYRLRIS